MWINITTEIFEKAEFKSLNFLYQILSWYPNGSPIRYNFAIDTEKVKDTENFKKLSSIEKNLKEFLDIEYTDFKNSSASNSYKIAQKKARENFNIEEAILFFNQSVSIVLENNKNDSKFIRTVIRHFGKVVDGVNEVEEHLNNGWIQFENAGGCTNIPNFMEAFLARFKKIADKNNRDVSDYFKGIIIIDSDKEFENQPSKHDILIQKLNDLGIDTSKIHILEKRMMENYLPKDVFSDIHRQDAVKKDSDLKDWLEAYFNLTDKQLDFVNISDGFPPKNNKYDGSGSRKSVATEILTLFSLSVTDENFKKLDKGFKFQGFDDIGNLKIGSSFKEEFPNLFRKSIVNKQNLVVRDGNGELQLIANKITNLL